MSVNAINHQKTIQETMDMSVNKANERKTDTLGKDDFLNLLIMQLRYQDPMNPVDDKEFIAQMAQFSALEQMQNMNTNFSNLKAFGMIGKHIQATITDGITKGLQFVEGIVDSVRLEGGKTFLEVNGRDMPVERVTTVSEGSVILNDDISKYTGLIGHKVEGIVYDYQTGDIVGVTGVVREIQKGRFENYALMDDITVNVASIINNVPSTDPNFRKNYLTDNIGKEVSIVISDDRNRQVPITGVLREFSINEDGKITAVIDRLLVPVESIHNIKGKADSKDF